MKQYQLSGYVYGKLWGGGHCAYPSTIITRNSKQEIIDEANKMLKDNSLDAGMGFEYLESAYLNLKTTDTMININGKLYQNKSFENICLGNQRDVNSLIKVLEQNCLA